MRWLLFISAILFAIPCTSFSADEWEPEFFPSSAPQSKIKILDSSGNPIDSSNPLKTSESGLRFVDSANSTTSNLNVDAFFPGAWVDTEDYSTAVIHILTDQDSAVNGVEVQCGTDGVNPSHIHQYSAVANTPNGMHIVATLTGGYYRVKYTNGGVQQTSFNLSSTLSKDSSSVHSHPVEFPFDGNHVVTIGRVVLAAKNPGGVYGNINRTTGGNLKISLEELESGISSNSNTQLNVTPFNTSGVELSLYVNDPMLTMAHGSNPLISAVSKVNKYGLAPNGVQITATDIWDRADATPTQQIWLAPTAARIHELLSSVDADSDTGGAIAQGAGCRTLRLWGLKTWATLESSEDIVMDGTDGTDTANSYVIIHRMKCLTFGASGPNVGTITAVAAADATVTVQIGIGKGQTGMAILGVSSLQTAYMTGYDISMHEAGTPANPNEMDFTMLVNESPDVDTTVFLNKSNLGLIATGTNAYPKKYRPYKTIPGPAIIKFQALATVADSEGVAEFDLILVNN